MMNKTATLIKRHLPADPLPLPPADDPVEIAKISVSTTDGAQRWFEAMRRRARREGVFVVEEFLTPALARFLLDNNPQNRPVGRRKVEEMAEDMRHGRFDSLNGQTFHISICGLLNDGQHRLHAKLESAAADIKFRFMFGLPREARLTIDQGRPRTAGDYLGMSNHSQGAAAAAVATLLHGWETEGAVRGKGGGSVNRLSRSEIADYARKHYAQIRASLDAIERRPGIGALGGLGLIAFCHLVLAEKHFAGATDFINRLVSGAELEDLSPINTLRRRLTTDRRLRREEKFELIMRAWNAWRRNEKPKTLVINKRIPPIAN
jgi:hypothetical protein